jgi:selenocysteine lyase/cysteine desulfurase
MGLGASLSLLLGIGIPKIHQRITALTEHLCESARSAGLGVFSSRRPPEQSGIVSLIASGSDVRHLVKRCQTEGIVINHRAGRLRVSPHCYNTRDEIDRLMRVLVESRIHLK